MRSSLLIMFVLILSTTSCKDEAKVHLDNAAICKLLSEMTQHQNSIQKTSQRIDPFFEVLDSMRIAQNLSRDAYAKLPREEQLQWGKQARMIAKNRSKNAQQYKDSMQIAHLKQRAKNTQKLIAIIKERGWFHPSTLGCKSSLSPASILKQAPKEYWDILKPLIDIEHQKNRMSTQDYESLYLVFHQTINASDFSKK